MSHLGLQTLQVWEGAPDLVLASVREHLKDLQATCRPAVLRGRFLLMHSGCSVCRRACSRLLVSSRRRPYVAGNEAVAGNGRHPALERAGWCKRSAGKVCCTYSALLAQIICLLPGFLAVGCEAKSTLNKVLLSPGDVHLGHSVSRRVGAARQGESYA